VAAVTVAAVGGLGVAVSSQAAQAPPAAAWTSSLRVGSAPSTVPVTVAARTVLARLAVRAESHAGSYLRARFKTWIDADRDGCDTRQEVLIAESTVRAKLGARCTVLAGRWVSLYDGIATTSPRTFDIDHVVPLEEAWTSGAWSWTTAKRTDYANDLGYGFTLQAVSAHSNRSKGDRDPAQWLPARSVCTYAVRWVAIKYRWALTVDAAEKTTLARLLTGACGNTKIALPPRGH
jgi:Protein of unknown function (DUF1524)